MQDGRRAVIALDEAVVHEGDCLELLREVPDESIDLTIFSPPYDGIRDYEKGWTLDLAALGKELYRVTKPNRVCVMVMEDGTEKRARTLSTWRTAVNWVDEAGWRLFQDIVYARDGNPGPWWNTRFRVDHEYICVFFKGDDLEVFRKEHLAVPSKHAGRTFTGTDRLTDGTTRKIDGGVVADTKCRGTIWRYSTSNSEGNSLKMEHPATFPDKMAGDLIEAFSNPGDLVLDPTCGSGTTLIEAIKSDRRALGFEINPEYAAIGRKRVLAESRAIRLI